MAAASTRRACADHLRVVTRRRRLDAVLARQRPADPTAGPDRAVEAVDLLDKLPQERRSALVLTELIGLSYDEAAAVDGVAIGTIRSRVARGRRAGRRPADALAS